METPDGPPSSAPTKAPSPADAGGSPAIGAFPRICFFCLYDLSGDRAGATACSECGTPYASSRWRWDVARTALITLLVALPLAGGTFTRSMSRTMNSMLFTVENDAYVIPGAWQESVHASWLSGGGSMVLLGATALLAYGLPMSVGARVVIALALGLEVLVAAFQGTVFATLIPSTQRWMGSGGPPQVLDWTIGHQVYLGADLCARTMLACITLWLVGTAATSTGLHRAAAFSRAAILGAALSGGLMVTLSLVEVWWTNTTMTVSGPDVWTRSLNIANRFLSFIASDLAAWMAWTLGLYVAVALLRDIRTRRSAAGTA